MIILYDWQRKDALLRAKAAAARHLLGRVAHRAPPGEVVRLTAAVAAADEHLRVHQMNKPQQENDRE